MEIKDNKLKNSDLFTKEKRKMGLPITVFAFYCLITIFSFITILMYSNFYIAIILTVIFVIVVYIPLYLVHIDDPVGYRTWVVVLFSPENYHNNFSSKRKITIVNINNDNVMYTTLKQYFYMYKKEN